MIYKGLLGRRRSEQPRASRPTPIELVAVGGLTRGKTLRQGGILMVNLQIIREMFGGVGNSLNICGKIYRYEFKCNDKNDF